MPRFCSSCGAPMAEGAVTCSACGTSAGQPVGGGTAAAPPTTTVSAGGLQDNIAGMLAYITFIPAIIFLMLEPYNRNRFIRFHAFQCLFLTIGLVVIHVALFFVPIVGWAISMLVSLGAFILWIVCLIKANQGQMFKLPIIGDMAEKQAAAM